MVNKSDFRGFKQVFLFEFITGIKKTTFKVFLAIICAMAFCAMPIIIIIGKISSTDDASNDPITKSSIESVYIYDETGLTISYEALSDMEAYADISFITDSEMSYDGALDYIRDNSDSNDLVIRAKYDGSEGFDITIVRSRKSSIKDEDLENFENDYQTFYREEILKNLGVSEEDYEYLSKEVTVTVLKQAKDGSFSEDVASLSYDDYSVLLAGLMIVFMFINTAVGNVASSIATEKSSRVIEFLLTGTRPLALLSGKIMARLLESLITIFAAYSSYFLSQLVCVFLLADNTISSSASDSVVLVSSIWETITPARLIVAVIYFLSGLVLFSIIGALTGASVQKLDELQDAYKLYSFSMVFCMYADMFLIIGMLSSGGLEAFKYFCSIFPFTGAFLTPALILTGKISALTGTIALIVIIISAGVFFILASAVYESMLLFQGKRLKIKDIVTLMKKQVVV